MREDFYCGTITFTYLRTYLHTFDSFELLESSDWRLSLDGGISCIDSNLYIYYSKVRSKKGGL
jgi:hypothetical protein